MITSTDENQELLNSINKQLGSLGDSLKKFNMTANGRTNADKQLTNDLKKTYGERESIEKKIASTGKKLLSGMDGVKDILLGMGTFGAVTAGLIEAGNKTAESYRKVQQVGQSFGGSMINLAKAAADAGMPLGEFADAIRQNGAVVAKIGSDSFGSINKQVRLMTLAQGHYGMSLDELTKFTGDYLETQRLAGTLEGKTDKQRAKSIKELAASVSTISGITGKAQDQIMETAQNALRDSSVSAFMRQNSISGMNQYNDALQKAVTVLAGQTGEAGEMLSKALADTASAFGQGQLTDIGKSLIDAGVGGAVGVLNGAASQIRAGGDPNKAAMEMSNRLYDIVNNPQQLQSLRIQALAGNAAAKQILSMAQGMKKYTKAEWDAQQKQKENIGTVTAFFESFKTIWDALSASFVKGFLKPFSDSKGGTQKLLDTFMRLAPSLEKFGGYIGNFIAKLANIDESKIESTFTGLIDGVGKAVALFKGLLDIGGQIIKGWGGFIDIIHKLPFLNNGLGTLIGILTPILAYKGVKSIIATLFKSFLGTMVGTMKVNAGVVNVNGGSSGDLSDLLDFGKKGGKGAGGLANEVKALGKGEKAQEIIRAALKANPSLAKEADMLKLAKEFGMMKELSAATRSLGMFGRIGVVFGRFSGAVEGLGGAVVKFAPWLGKLAPMLGTAAKILGPIGAAIGVGMGSFELFNTFKAHKDGTNTRKRSNMDRAGSALGGAATGALAGAAVGSVVPIIGTAIGAIVGGVGGAVIGAWGQDIAGWAGDKMHQGGKGSAGAPTPPVAANNIGDTGTDDATNQQTDALQSTADTNDQIVDLLKKILDADARHNDNLIQLQAIMYTSNRDNSRLLTKLADSLKPR